MMAQKVEIPNHIMLAEVSNILREGKSVIIMTKGGSMMPFIRGEVDSVELVYRDNYSAGDIVLAQIRPEHYVLHRLKSIDGEDVVLKGDGNLDSVENCRKSDICGVVVNILRPSGKAIDCTTARFSNLSRRWREAPRFFRRYFLAIFRRLI